MIGGVIGNYASRTFLPSLGFFSCNVFLLLVGIRYSCTFVAKVLEKYRSKGDKRNISKLHCLEVYDENLWFGVLRLFVGGQGWLLMVSLL